MRHPGPRTPDNRSLLFCDHCKRNGHTSDECYKIHGYSGANNDNTSKGRGGIQIITDKVTEVHIMLG